MSEERELNRRAREEQLRNRRAVNQNGEYVFIPDANERVWDRLTPDAKLARLRAGGNSGKR